MFKKIMLKNGVRLVYENIPYVRSVSVGIWVGTGSRSEDLNNNGISHFIEHMLFKGTANRSAKEIAETIDAIGGQINAFTGKECTCYYTKTLDTHLNIALDVLTDMYFNSKFEAADINTEKKVVIEEISMYEDTPEELVHDIFSEMVWHGNSLGYPILGTQECISKFNKKMIKQYMKEYYTPYNTVISVAGNFDERELTEIITKYFGDWNYKGSFNLEYSPVEYKIDKDIRRKETEQIHLCMGFEGIRHGDDSIYPLLALNNILGGGMSSRLFQNIREKKGLVYSIYSYPSTYMGAGLFMIYAGMNPEYLQKVVDLTKKEINILTKNGITQDELNKSKDQLKGSYILGLESIGSRMNSIGKSELMLGKIETPEEVIEKMDNIKIDDVYQIIEKIFKYEKMSISAVGNLKNEIIL
ncbi:putative Zn-dependent peptidase [Ruminiclostridium sufflavum DSM 19573]|uniref:Putative Zn-dependent peptidase n=1 Tax=Ruminiclostridium sufflavum DSM 19573 TaxID=1121337 RepID=A0A318XJV3_9FIRM|nr:pitrilysin family protein [Ruminiclostridium sufflavum]PYG87555.1 putative Zn-dependent peptidase [Ruminiclostridium sufflavum DSM 19573]